MSEQPKQRVTFIGLGAMGYPMAGHLANNGYAVTVYNRTIATAEKWLEEGKSMSSMPVELKALIKLSMSAF